MWIVDIGHIEVLIHRRPQAQLYGEITTARPGDTVTVAGLPGVQIHVADLFAANDEH